MKFGVLLRICEIPENQRNKDGTSPYGSKLNYIYKQTTPLQIPCVRLRRTLLVIFNIHRSVNR